MLFETIGDFILLQIHGRSELIKRQRRVSLTYREVSSQ
jgi:hypothetical protein